VAHLFCLILYVILYFVFWPNIRLWIISFRVTNVEGFHFLEALCSNFNWQASHTDRCIFFVLLVKRNFRVVLYSFFDLLPTYVYYSNFPSAVYNFRCWQNFVEFAKMYALQIVIWEWWRAWVFVCKLQDFW